MKRSEARERIFRILFQYEFHDDFDDRWHLLLQEESLRGTQGEYAISTIQGILDNLSEIDGIISSRLKSWTFDRLSRPAMTLLRLGVYELCFNSSIPNVTAVDEAVRLSFVYCDEKEAAFVNGLLNGVLKDDGVLKR